MDNAGDRSPMRYVSVGSGSLNAYGDKPNKKEDWKFAIFRNPGHELQARDDGRGGEEVGQTRHHARHVQRCRIGRSLQ